MPSPSVVTLNYKIVFHDVGRRSVNLDSLPWLTNRGGLTMSETPSFLTRA
jgi:hypothetical protein